jgi:hypothetical protein
MPGGLCTAQHSTAQHSTAQHSTAQHSTAQHSTAQHSTARAYTSIAQRHHITLLQQCATPLHCAARHMSNGCILNKGPDAACGSATKHSLVQLYNRSNTSGTLRHAVDMSARAVCAQTYLIAEPPEQPLHTPATLSQQPHARTHNHKACSSQQVTAPQRHGRLVHAAIHVSACRAMRSPLDSNTVFVWLHNPRDKCLRALCDALKDTSVLSCQPRHSPCI